MILGRNLSKSKFLTAAVASSTQYWHSSFSLVPSHSQKRGFCFSSSRVRPPRFDLGCMRGPDDAIALFQDMVRMRPWPPVSDFTKLLTAVVKMKQYSVALHLFDEMLQKDAPVNHYTLTIAIDCFCKLKKADFGFAILGAFFKRGYEPNVVTFTILISGLLSVGRIDDAAQLMRKLMDEELCKPDVFTYTSLIQGLCNTRRWNEAQVLLKEMVARKVYPNVVTYNTMLRALLSEGRLEDGLDLFKEMKALQLSPTIVTYNTLIHGLCNDGKLFEAKDLFDELPSKGLQPDVVTYTTLIGALCRQGQIDEAKDLLFQMVKHRCLPNRVTYFVLIQGLLKRNKIEEAMHFLEEMDTKQYCYAPPDVFPRQSVVPVQIFQDDLRRDIDLSQQFEKLRAHNKEILVNMIDHATTIEDESF